MDVADPHYRVSDLRRRAGAPRSSVLRGRSVMMKFVVHANTASDRCPFMSRKRPHPVRVDKAARDLFRIQRFVKQLRKVPRGGLTLIASLNCHVMHRDTRDPPFLYLPSLPSVSTIYLFHPHDMNLH